MKKTLLSLFLAVFTVASMNAQVIFLVESPASIEGSYDFTYTDPTGWANTPDLTDDANAVNGILAMIDDGTAGDSLGCGISASLSGKVALIYRGACEFGMKISQAEAAGAIGAIIVNNIPGAPIAMGAGAVGNDVTIPAIMVTDQTGALLRQGMAEGDVSVFYGTKLLDVNVGFTEGGSIMASSAARPHVISDEQDEFGFDPGIVAINYGVLDQTGVTATAVISRDGSEVYNETLSDITLNSGDTLLVSFPPFYPAGFEKGEYTTTYTLQPTATDEYTLDNERSFTTVINDEVLAYATTDPSTFKSTPSAHYRPSTGIVFQSCVAFKDDNAADLKPKGVSFSATTTDGISLDGEYIEIEIFRWEDDFIDFTVEPTFDDLVFEGSLEYFYDGDLQGEVVYVALEDDITLLDDQRYLVCAKSSNDALFFGYEANRDYQWTIETYLEPISPVNTDGTWYATGFGTETTSALGLHFDGTIGITEKSSNDFETTPFPNPAASFVNVPLANEGASLATVTITDLTGKTVATQDAVVVGKVAKVNTSSLDAGTYNFSLELNNGESTAFKVMIAR